MNSEAKKTLITTCSVAAVVTLILGLFFNWLYLPAWTIHSMGIWAISIFLVTIFNVIFYIGNYISDEDWKKATPAPGLILVILIIVFIINIILGSRLLNAKDYSTLITVEEATTNEIPSSDGTNSIALMDTSSAEMLGDRKIGGLSDVVSQYNVGKYTQINIENEPVKAAPLEYAGFWKWNSSKDNGVPGIVNVNPVEMEAEYKSLPDNNGMKYIPSAYFSKDLKRHIRSNFKSILFDYPHFEEDENGNPYYIAPTYKTTIGLFGGKTYTGAIIIDPITGKMNWYSLEEVPTWVDVIFDGDFLCQRYNDSAQLMNGFWNSKFGQKNCRKVTTMPKEKDDDEDDSNVEYNDYGYIAKNDDIYIYTGVTSMNGDSSNLGFIMANERTGKIIFIPCPGADEFSAMHSAEGTVQEKGYKASFPSLILVNEEPTYIMVLKDDAGLIRLYATVNVSQYNTAVTAETQKDCVTKYSDILNGKISTDTVNKETDTKAESNTTIDTSNWEEKTITIQLIQTIVVDGDTYIYVLSTDGKLYSAKYVNVLGMIGKVSGESITIKTDGETFILAN